MQTIYTSLQTDKPNHTNTLLLNITGHMLFLTFNQQCQSTEGLACILILIYLILMLWLMIAHFLLQKLATRRAQIEKTAGGQIQTHSRSSKIHFHLTAKHIYIILYSCHFSSC